MITTFIVFIIMVLTGLYLGWNSKRWYMNWRYDRVWLCVQEFGHFDAKYTEKYVMPGNFVWKYETLKDQPIFLYEDGTTSQKHTTWRANLADFRERN